MSLKKFDRDSSEFKMIRAMLVMSGIAERVIVIKSFKACEEAWKQSGETGIMPTDVGSHVDSTALLDAMTDGYFLRKEGVAREEVLKEVQIEFASNARKAVTAYLAQRVTA